jgi:hypothetical protein
MTCNQCGSNPIPENQPSSCEQTPMATIACFTGQALPYELPTEGIPVEAIAYTPPSGPCSPATSDLVTFLDRLNEQFFNAFCPNRIAGLQGDCNVLQVKAGKVEYTPLATIFESCVTSITPTKIKAGDPDTVLMTDASGMVKWGMIENPDPVTGLPVPPTSPASTTVYLSNNTGGTAEDWMASTCIPIGDLCPSKAGALDYPNPNTPSAAGSGGYKRAPYYPYRVAVGTASLGTVQALQMPSVLNNITALNTVIREDGREGWDVGGTTWVDSNGVVTVKRASWYQISVTSYLRVTLNSLPAVAIGSATPNTYSVYSGITLSGSTGVVIRVGEATGLANGITNVFAHSGSTIAFLDVGDKVWVRAVIAPVSGGNNINFAGGTAEFRGDAASRLSIAELVGFGG